MASFGWTAPTPALLQYSQPDVDQAAQQTTLGGLGIQRQQGILASIGQLQQLGPGLASGDPAAIGQAMTLDPSVSGPALQNVGSALQDQRTRGVLADLGALKQIGPGLAQGDPAAFGQAIGLDPSVGGAAVSAADAIQTRRLAMLGQLMNAPMSMQDYQQQAPALRGYIQRQLGMGGAGGTFTPGQPGSFLQQLQQHESPDPHAINAQGYVGSFQFGEQRLKDLGLYQPASGENPEANRWQGTFNIPGFPDVKTLPDFLGSKGAQNAAAALHVGNIDHAIANTPGTQALDPNGLRAVAHLGGVSGMQRFVKSGGLYNPADANGTRLSDYYQRFSQGQPAAASAPGPQQAAPAQLAANTGAPGSTMSDAPQPGIPASPPAAAPGGALANIGAQTSDIPATGQNTIVRAGQPEMIQGSPGQVMVMTPNGLAAGTLPGAHDQRRVNIVQDPGTGRSYITQGGDVKGFIQGTSAPDIKRQELGAEYDMKMRYGPELAGATKQAELQAQADVEPGLKGREAGAVAATNLPYQLYDEDRKRLADVQNDVQNTQNAMTKTLEQRQVLAGLPTGAQGQSRADLANWAQTYLPDSMQSTVKQIAKLPDAQAAQEFSKLALQNAGNQERQVLGGRGGFRAIEMYKQANPSMELQPGANRDILNLQLVAQQADMDYGRGMQQYVSDQATSLRSHGSYQPASEFDKQWTAQNNPQVYVAATSALNGKPFADWAKGLSPDQAQRALGVIARIDPTATVQGRKGTLPVQSFAGN